MPEFYSNGLRLFYSEQGMGSPVILLHELGGSNETWSELQPLLAAQGFRVVAPDLRGAGQSDVPVKPYTLADLAMDVLALMDRLEAYPAFVAGLAAGGLVALQVAALALDRVSGLVLLDTPLRVSEASAAYTRTRAEIVRRQGMHAVVDMSMSRSFPDTIQVDQAMSNAYRTRFLANDPQGYALASLAIANADFTNTASTFNVPALVLVGEHDLLFPPSQVRELAETLPQATFRVIPGAGHFPPLQTPDLVYKEVSTFLREQVRSKNFTASRS